MDITLPGGPAGEFGRGFVYRGLEKVLVTGNFLCRGPVKNHGRVRSPGTLRDIQWGALETEHLPLWVLCEGNLEGWGGPLLGTLKVI